MDISGLSQAESKVYQSLLKLKESSVREISKDTGFHRTNIYDVLEQLQEKGLVSCYRQGKTSLYKCLNPLNIYNYIEEKKQELDTLMPQLLNRFNEKKEEIEIEVFKGEKGMVAAYKDILRVKKPVDGLGISRKMQTYIPNFRDQFFREVKKLKIKFRLIYTKRMSPLQPPFECRYLYEDYTSPMEVLLYGNNTLQIMWEPDMRAVIIKNRQFTETYQKYFEYLWTKAKPM